MAKTKISQFDAVASNNTDINSVNVAEGCPPSGINNAIREMASLLKKQEVGTDAMTSPDIDGGTIDGATIGGSSGVTIGVSDGTVSAPSIKFTSDTNTGIYRGGTDILKFVTAGTDAVTIDASQNVDINGTVTADGLTVSTDSYRQLLLTFPDSFTSKLQLGFSNFYLQGSGTTDELTIANNSSGQTKFINQSKTSMLIDNSGDISFYEDTGTTAKLFWDASTERLGIGTVSPSEVLEISKDDRANGATLRITNSASSSSWISGDIIGTIDFYSSDASDADVRSRIQSVSTGGATSPGAVDLTFSTFSSSTLEEKLRITSDGNVGIGTSSPLRQLSISNASNAEISFISGTSSNASILFGDGITGTDVYRGYIQYQHPIDSMIFATSAIERMRIDSSGNVGIGTNSPSRQLTVSNSGGALLSLVSTGDDNCQVLFGDSASDTVGKVVYNHSTNAMSFEINGSEAMRIDSTGNVLVGTTSYAAGQNAKLLEQNGQVFFSRATTGQAGQLVFQNPNGSVGQVVTSGTSTAYNTSSDYRLKENVTADWDATTRLKQLNPVRFNFIADADTTVDGFLAHEVQSVVPEAITGTHNEVDDDGNPVYQGIDQSKLVPLLVKTIQELEARITALETA